MWDFNIGQALSLMMRTTPFILFRAAVYFGIALAYILVTGVGAALAMALVILAMLSFKALRLYGVVALGLASLVA